MRFSVAGFSNSIGSLMLGACMCIDLAGCTQGTQLQQVDQEQVWDNSPSDLVGTWSWVKSTEDYGLQEVAPPFRGHQHSLMFEEGGRYAEFRDGDEALVATYSAGEGEASALGARRLPVIQLSRTVFFNQFSPDSTFAFRAWADTLQLIGTSTDAWSHFFVRVHE